MYKFSLLKKNKKIHSEKDISQFSLKPLKKLSGHNSMTENVVKYLNMTIKDKLVEIIYLQLFSLLK